MLGKRGQSNIVSYVMLVAIGAIIAVAFFYIYSAATAGTQADVSQKQAGTLERVRAAMTISAPPYVKNASLYRVAVYNSGITPLTGMGAVVVFSNGTREVLPLQDKAGENVTYLGLSDVAFVPMGVRPMAGDILLISSGELLKHKYFRIDTLRVQQADGIAELNAIDGSAISVSDDVCYANNTFEWDLGMPESDTSKVYIEGYFAGQGDDLSYYEITDEGGFSVEDSVDNYERAVYDVSDATYAGNTLSLCVKNIRRAGLEIDYMKVVVIY